MKEKAKPFGYWRDKDNCLKAALECDSRSEFQKKHSRASAVCREMGWFDEACSHMIQHSKPNGYWTKEICQEAALKYNTRKEFSKGNIAACTASYRAGFIDEVCSHMTMINKPNGYWTKEKCQEAALEYKFRSHFQKKHSGAYKVSSKNNWLDEVCSHMIQKGKPRGYWKSKENCLKAALKCDSRSEFTKKYSGAYKSCKDNGWLKKAQSHMKVKGNLKMRKIYVFEFFNNHAYVGLSYDPDVRKYKHLNSDKDKSSVYRFLKKNKEVKYNFKVLTPDFLPIEEASKKERFYIKQYKDNNWIMLNKAKGGAVGGSKLYWTKKRCIDIANKYKCVDDFRKKEQKCYRAILKSKWLNEVCSHMKQLTVKPQGYWNDKNNCKEIVIKYSDMSKFRKEQPGCLESINRNNWNKLLSHLYIDNTKKKSGYWTKERCIEEAIKYSSRKEFYKNSSGCYSKAYENDWLNEACSHMIQKNKPNGYWTKEKCQEVAIKYDNKVDFEKHDNAALQASRRYGWYYDVCSHMKLLKKPNGYWTKKRCIEAALKCSSRSELERRFSSAKNKARLNGWLDEICSHMNTVKTKPYGYWTIDRVKKESSKYSSRSEFSRNASGAYHVAKKKKILDELF